MTWELRNVKDIPCTIDDSEVYTVISRITENKYNQGFSHREVIIRVDVMTTGDNEPLMSFQGNGNDVRKAVIAWLWNNGAYYQLISREHTSYIGYEISRAMTTEHYVQD